MIPFVGRGGLENTICPSWVQPDRVKPYIIKITNNVVDPIILNPIPATAYLFGYNQFFNQPNFGNPAGMVITCPNFAYVRLYAQSQNKPFEIESYYTVANSMQLAQTMSFTWTDANGRTCTDPVPAIYTDPYQYQSTIDTYKFPARIDGNSLLTIPMLASGILILALFPKQLVDVSRPMIGLKARQQFETVKLGGQNLNIKIS